VCNTSVNRCSIESPARSEDPCEEPEKNDDEVHASAKQPETTHACASSSFSIFRPEETREAPPIAPRPTPKPAPINPPAPGPQPPARRAAELGIDPILLAALVTRAREATGWDDPRARREVSGWLAKGYNPAKIRNALAAMERSGKKIPNPGGWMTRTLEATGPDGPPPPRPKPKLKPEYHRAKPIEPKPLPPPPGFASWSAWYESGCPEVLGALDPAPPPALWSMFGSSGSMPGDTARADQAPPRDHPPVVRPPLRPRRRLVDPDDPVLAKLRAETTAPP